MRRLVGGGSRLYVDNSVIPLRPFQILDKHVRHRDQPCEFSTMHQDQLELKIASLLFLKKKHKKRETGIVFHFSLKQNGRKSEQKRKVCFFFFFFKELLLVRERKHLFFSKNRKS